MRVLYDSQLFSWQKYGGISRYFVEIIQEMNSSYDIKAILPYMFSENVFLKELKFLRYSDISYLPLFKGRNVLLGLLNKKISIRYLENTNFDIFHPTYYDPYFWDYADSGKVVLTIHDMIHELFPNMFLEKDMTSKHKRESIKRCENFIAISKNTKKDLVRLFDIEPEKVEVVYHGSHFDKVLQKEVETPDRYLLYVGERLEYKNFRFMVEAVADMIKKRKIYIYCVGKSFDKDEKMLFEVLGVKDYMLQYRANDNELKHLYSNALGFIFPSIE